MSTKRKENAVINHALITGALEEAQEAVPVETTLPRPPVKLESATALQLNFKSSYACGVRAHTSCARSARAASIDARARC